MKLSPGDPQGDLGRPDHDPAADSPDARPHSRRKASSDDADKLIQEFLDGQAEAVRIITEWVRSVAVHKAWGFDSSQDLVQAILLILVQNFRKGRFRGGNLRAYVRRISKNMCIDNYRKARTRGLHASLEDKHRELSGRSEEATLENRAMLNRILERIDSECRKLLLLAYIKGYSRKEISGMLSIKEETVRVRLFRCVRKSRAMISETNGGMGETTS
jgi:RNA polymerase sigma-70 factor (ECF subfamily)